MAPSAVLSTPVTKCQCSRLHGNTGDVNGCLMIHSEFAASWLSCIRSLPQYPGHKRHTHERALRCAHHLVFTLLTPPPSPYTHAGHYANSAAQPAPLLPGRLGGSAMRLCWGAGHALCHVSLAVSLLLVLELGLELCSRHAGLGADGWHSLYRWMCGRGGKAL
jgi:hypothetical protein